MCCEMLRFCTSTDPEMAAQRQAGRTQGRQFFAANADPNDPDFAKNGYPALTSKDIVTHPAWCAVRSSWDNACAEAFAGAAMPLLHLLLQQGWIAMHTADPASLLHPPSA